MSQSNSALCFWQHAAGHGLHIVVLLLPTLLIMGISGVDWLLILFTCGIGLAAFLESAFVKQCLDLDSNVIRDYLAMRVAFIVGVSLLVLFWLAQIERIVQPHTNLSFHWIGGLMLLTGIVLRIESTRMLGTQFVSDIRVGAAIHDGIYAWLRHPSEIGLLLIATGAPLMIGSLFTTIIAASLLIPISLWRMNRENIAFSKN